LQRIRLDPKITAITGPSDVGKSSILRAIRWLATNRPLGDGFIRDDADNTSVTLWTDDDKLKRRKGDENTYEVNGKELKAFGTDVPSDVTDALKVDEVNFAGQHDSPFWFDLTPGEVARKLNEIVDLTLIDTVMKDLGSRLTRNRTEQKVIKERKEDAEKELEELDFVRDMEVALFDLETDEEHLLELKGRWVDVEELINNCEAHTYKKEEMTRYEVAISKVLKAGAQAKKSADGLQRLRCIRMAIEGHQKKASREIPDVSKLEELKVEMRTTGEKWKDIYSLVNLIEAKQTSFNQAERVLREAEETFKEEMGETCPLCNSPVKESWL
jgi:exonuclease SbcC